MVFIILIAYGVAAGWVLIAKKKMKISQVFLPLMAFAIVSSVALGQNDTESLIPEASDGIGIFNFLAIV